MGAKDLKKFPRLGDEVMVWPGQKKVRDEGHRPVKNADGDFEMRTAYVRDHRGNLMTGAVPVLVTTHYFKLLVSGHLAWSTKEEYLANKRASKKDQPVMVDEVVASAITSASQPAATAESTGDAVVDIETTAKKTRTKTH